MSTAKQVMQSALDQWVAIEKLTDTAKEVLPPDECRVIDKTAQRGASRTLSWLDEHRRKTPTPTPDRVDRTVTENVLEETPGIQSIRHVLQNIEYP